MGKFYGTRTPNTSDCWQTPKNIVESLGEFDLDPAANPLYLDRLAKKGLSEGGLENIWKGRVWLNPPYGSQCKNWINKLANHGNGIALIPARVGSKWFHVQVFKRCDAILFLEGRIAFLNSDLVPVKGSNIDCVIVAYGNKNVIALRNCELSGELWDRSNIHYAI